MNVQKSKRLFIYNRAIFITLTSTIDIDRSDNMRTLLSETWICAGAFRKNLPYFDFDAIKFGKSWSFNVTIAGISFGLGAVREELPFFGV